MLDTLMAPGMMTDRGELSSPRSLMFRYLGIMPPEKNMVKVTSIVKNLRPEKVLRARG